MDPMLSKPLNALGWTFSLLTSMQVSCMGISCVYSIIKWSDRHVNGYTSSSSTAVRSKSVVTCGSLKGVCANGTGITTTKEINGLRPKQPFRSVVVCVNGMAHKSSVMKG